MYNAKIKNSFIESVSASESYRALCRSVFRSVEAAEKSIDADICTLSSEALTPIINKAISLRSSGHNSKLNVLKRYCKYCVDIGVPGACMEIDNIVIDTSDKIRREMISGPVELQMQLNKIFDPEKDGTVDTIYRCYYWFAFSGMDEDEIFTLKKENIDLIRGIATINTQEYPLYKEAYPAIVNAMELTQFRFRHSGYKNDIFKDRAQGDLLMRCSVPTGGRSNVFSVESMTATFKVAINRAYKNAVSKNPDNIKPLNYSRTRISGLFYRKYEQERASMMPYEWYDFQIDAESLMHTDINDKSANYYVKSNRNRFAKTLFEDYKKWKSVFST